MPVIEEYDFEQLVIHGSPETADDSHGQIKTDQHKKDIQDDNF